jgi:hypothetical protein
VDGVVKAGLIDEIFRLPLLVATDVGVRRIPLPDRGDRGRDPLVPEI